MRIGVIGSAVVGQTIANGLTKHVYEIRIASRTPAKLGAFSKTSGLQVGTLTEVAAWAVVLAAGAAAEETVDEMARRTSKKARD